MNALLVAVIEEECEREMEEEYRKQERARKVMEARRLNKREN